MTDTEIISIYREGKREEAFRHIVGNYSERLYWHVRRFLCCHEDTNDLLQDIFIKVWTALPSFRGESKLFTWLYRIATNEVLNHLRKHKAISLLRMHDAAETFEKRIDEDPYFDGNKMQRELHKCIQRLPEKQRTVFSLRYFDEIKYEDIAEITGTSVGALKASYHHAYGKLKKSMEEKFL